MAIHLSEWLTAVRSDGRGYTLSIDFNSHHPDEAIRKTCKKKQEVFNAEADAELLIKAANARSDNVFITLAQFQNDSPARKAKFTDSFKSLWIDVDCDPKKPYQTKEQAIAAAKSFSLR